MTEEGLLFVCDEAACGKDRRFYETFELDERWAIIRAILNAADEAPRLTETPH